MGKFEDMRKSGMPISKAPGVTGKGVVVARNEAGDRVKSVLGNQNQSLLEKPAPKLGVRPAAELQCLTPLKSGHAQVISARDVRRRLLRMSRPIDWITSQLPTVQRLEMIGPGIEGVPGRSERGREEGR